MPQYTLLCTSCGRPDLLERTFTSFQATARPGPQYIVVVDDAGMERPEWFPRHNAKWISNPTRRGQIYCADVLWQNCKTEYAFWLEDDWEFKDGGYIEQSFDILETEGNKDILLVQIPGDDPLPVKLDPSRGIYVAERDWGMGWSGFTFNPGMRRHSDYKRIGSYGRHVGYDPRGCGELALSKLYRSLRYYAARLQGKQYCRHIGEGRHVERTVAPPKRILVGVPSAKRLDYSTFRDRQELVWRRRWEFGVSGLQVDGENERVKATLETWFQDFKNFPNVTPKIFYGGEGKDTEDEVFLGCPDDHMHLPQKLQAMCRYAVEHNFDWMFRADDDSFVYPDRVLRQFLETEGDYRGYDEGGFAIGGRGSWLSNKALKLIAAADPTKYSSRGFIEWRDDAFAGAVLRDNGIKMTDLPGLLSPQEENPAIQTVTLHPVSPARMRELYKEYGSPESLSNLP